MMLNTVDEECSPIQGGTNVGFMVSPLMEGSEYVIKLDIFKVFKLI